MTAPEPLESPPPPVRPEDFEQERRDLRDAQTAMLNVLEDMDVERTRLNDAQRALMNMLEDVDTERARAEEANVRLEAVNRELEAFSYSVSHDLRAPLRAISGFSQAVVEDYGPRLDDEGRRYLGLIQKSAHKMGQLIDDLLTFSRLSRREMTTERIDMTALARTVFAEMAELAPERRIEFRAERVPPCRGDRAMLHQVLANLIGNAIKFTEPREEAVIRFGWREEDGAYYVKDNGVGFEMQYVGKLFGVFQRLHAVTEFEGTGVGLALVRRIISRHGGEVRAEGEVDRGAAFYFTLPEG